MYNQYAFVEDVFVLPENVRDAYAEFHPRSYDVPRCVEYDLCHDNDEYFDLRKYSRTSGWLEMYENCSVRSRRNVCVKKTA